MRELRITAAFGDYDRIAPLRTGDVRPRGIDLRVLILPPGEIFARMCAYLEFEASEMSMGTHLYLTGAGDGPFVGMPAFPSRAFRHAMAYVNVDSGIERPEDLNGRRIVIREWGMTAVVWIVGILAEEHGLDITSVEWLVQERPRVPIPMPPAARTRELPRGEDVSRLLETGAADAALLLHPPACFVAGSPRVRRLFPDYATAERDYHERTGIHPVMHCVVLRRDVWAGARWALVDLYRALCDARAQALNALRETGTLAASLPFLPAAVDELRARFGEDWWPYGLEANRIGLERLARYAHAQGLTARTLAVEEMFGPADWDGR
jgi:4,5-dihydroxyphthalate decarboxylase